MPVDYDPFAAEKFVNPVAKGMVGAVGNMATIPQRAIEAAENYQIGNPETMNAGPIADAAMLTMGGSMPFAEREAVGVFGGKLAQTANLKALARAQQMEEEGLEAEHIWKETGWYKGFPNEWMFEIPDEGLSITSGHGKLGAGTEHLELAKAYPQLSQKLNVNVAKENAEGFASGAYNRGHEVSNWPPTVRVDAGSAEAMRSTTAHELQHAVDDIEERLPLSGGPAEARQLIDRLPIPWKQLDNRGRATAARESYMRLAHEVRARNVQKRLSMTPEERAKIDPGQTQDRRNIEQIPNYDPYWLENWVVPEFKLKPVDHDPFAGSK